MENNNGVIKDTSFIKMADNLMPLEVNLITRLTDIYENSSVLDLMID